MYRPLGTISSVLNNIERNEIALPAIQREFVWSPDQICALFDSVMRGYPFGEFLLWKINPEHSAKYSYYDFVRRYHERDAAHCPELDPIENRQVTAVLDGQQRLTAFNIGLRGSMAVKLPGKRWNNPDAFPRRVLALDLLAQPDPISEGNRYAFEFIDEGKVGRDSDELWFKVSEILNMREEGARLRWIQNSGLGGDNLTLAFETLGQLKTAIHDKVTVHCYEEQNQNIEHVLNMFARRNRGGTTLSYSDLLLSMAASQWTQLDARKEIHELVDELNRIGSGFNFSKDFVMKAGFMLADIPQVTFSLANVTGSNMETIQGKWTAIREALTATVELVSSFGFDSKNIGADSALLPIAYFLYREDSPAGFSTRKQYEASRNSIRNWLTRSILKSTGVWGAGGGDAMLSALRDVIQSRQHGQFPVPEIERVMQSRNRGLEFSQDEIEDLSEVRFTQNQRIFPLLSLLFPFVNTRDNRFHIDHVFPKSRFTPTRLRAAGVNEQQIVTFRDHAERLANLQLLTGDINSEKRAKMPADWLDEQFGIDAPSRRDHCNDHLLGDVPREITSFEEFYETRRQRLQERIAELVNAV